MLAQRSCPWALSQVAQVPGMDEAHAPQQQLIHGAFRQLSPRTPQNYTDLTSCLGIQSLRWSRAQISPTIQGKPSSSWEARAALPKMVAQKSLLSSLAKIFAHISMTMTRAEKILE